MVLTLIFCFPIKAQEVSVGFYSVEQGLSNFVVSSLLEHSDGYVYVGTRNGLNRFDGYHFIPIPSHGILDSRSQEAWIMSQSELPNGNIYVIYSKSKASNQQTIGSVIFNPFTGKYVPVNTTTAMGFHGLISGALTLQSTVYIVGYDTDNFYLHQFDENHNFELSHTIPHGTNPEVLPYALEQVHYVHLRELDLIALSKEDTYLAYDLETGLRKLSLARPSSSFYNEEDIWKALGIAPNVKGKKLKVIQLSSGKILIAALLDGNVKGVFEYDQQQDKILMLNKNPEGWKNEIWNCDREGNIFQQLHNPTTNLTRSELILANTGETIHIPELDGIQKTTGIYGRNFSRLMYIATQRGIIRVTHEQSEFQTYLSRNLNTWDYNISGRGILELDNNIVLLATESEGIHRVDKRANSIDPLEFTTLESNHKLNTDYIFQLFKHSNDQLWATNDKGSILKLNLQTRKGQTYRPNSNFTGYTSFFLDDGRFILAGNTLDSYHIDIKLFDPETEKFSSLLIRNSDANFIRAIPSCIVYGPDENQLWLGTKTGLFLIDLEKSSILMAYLNKAEAPVNSTSSYQAYHILNADHVMVIHKDNDTALWLGMSDGGVNIVDVNTHSGRYITKPDGLPSNSVCGILSDSTGYWFATFHGLSHYNPTRNEFRNFYTSNGLSHNEFNRSSFYKCHDGIIFGGGLNGFNSFSPAKLLNQDTPQRLLLSEATYFNNDEEESFDQYFNFNDNPSFKIPSNSRYTSFRFTLTDYSSQEENTFSYSL